MHRKGVGLIRDTAVEGIMEFLTVKYLGIIFVLCFLCPVLANGKKIAMAQRGDLLKLTEFSQILIHYSF